MEKSPDITALADHVENSNNAPPRAVGAADELSNVERVLEIGAGNWDRETVERALAACKNSPNRAAQMIASDKGSDTNSEDKGSETNLVAVPHSHDTGIDNLSTGLKDKINKEGSVAAQESKEDTPNKDIGLGRSDGENTLEIMGPGPSNVGGKRAQTLNSMDEILSYPPQPPAPSVSVAVPHETLPKAKKQKILKGKNEENTSKKSCPKCRKSRKPCVEGCVFRPVYHIDRQSEYDVTDALFGVAKMESLLKNAKNPLELEAIKNSMLFEAVSWKKDPIRGPLGVVQDLQNDLALASAQQQQQQQPPPPQQQQPQQPPPPPPQQQPQQPPPQQQQPQQPPPQQQPQQPQQ